MLNFFLYEMPPKCVTFSGDDCLRRGEAELRVSNSNKYELPPKCVTSIQVTDHCSYNRANICKFFAASYSPFN